MIIIMQWQYCELSENVYPKGAPLAWSQHGNGVHLAWIIDAALIFSTMPARHRHRNVKFATVLVWGWLLGWNKHHNFQHGSSVLENPCYIDLAWSYRHASVNYDTFDRMELAPRHHHANSNIRKTAPKFKLCRLESSIKLV